MSDVISADLVARERSIEATIYLLDRFNRMRPMDFIRFFEEFASRVPRIRDREPELVSVPAPKSERSSEPRTGDSGWSSS